MAFKLNIGNEATKNAHIAAPIKKRGVLFGTGMTKAVIAKTNTKAAQKSISLQSSLDSETTKTKTAITVATKTETTVLPSALMDANIILDDSQVAAKNGLRNQKYGILIGSAGTGKTTTLRALLSEIESSLSYTEIEGEGKVPSIAFCSFMGKAVQQMKRALPPKYHNLCNTIHATLGFKPEYFEELNSEGELVKKMQFLPEFTEFNKLPYDAIVIDEIGTVGVPLWHDLLAATKPNCRIIMLGDLNQLVPVAGHSILGFAMLKWPTYELTTLHRNAGPIAEQAHRVINGFKPLTDKDSKKVIIKKIADGSLSARKEMLGIIRFMYDKNLFDPLLDAIIVPQNIDALGQLQFNEILVNLFNPDATRISIKAGYEQVVFGVGDKVMLLKNNTERGLTNGMQGVITSINANNGFTGTHHTDNAELATVTMDLDSFDSQFAAIAKQEEDEEELKESERAGSHVVTVQFQDVEGETEFSTVGQLKEITLSYVFTCHKSQGSEYRNVIVLAHSAAKKLLCREWLYTAMTRAKNNLLILCNNRGLAHAVSTQRIKGVTMEEKAKKFISLVKASKNEPPARLPDAVKIITKTNMQFNLKEDKTNEND